VTERDADGRDVCTLEKLDAAGSDGQLLFVLQR
jgi:hypothetical protein